MKCEDCKYVSYDEATGIFDCHHYAPRPVAELPREGCPMGSDFTRTLWPIVNPEDWCGEFEAKEETTLLQPEQYTVLVRRLLRIHTKNGTPITTVGQFLALTEYDVLSTKCAGETTLRDVFELQRKFKGQDGIK